MAPPKQRSRMTLAEQIADLEDPAPRDFDPEDQDLGGPGSDSDDARSAVDENAGREHYEVVGKGKLRKPETIRLGKEYAGSKVSREALEAESDDDPFRTRSSDEEGSEDEDDDEDGESGEDDEDDDEEEEDEESDASDAFGKTKRAKGKTNGVKSHAGKKARFADEDESVDGMDTDESGSDEGSEDGSEGSDGFDDEDDGDDDGSDLSDEDEDEALDLPKSKEPSDEREELRRLMATDQKTIAATISQAAKADAAKGMAVKQQRSTFDALLNTRIKLQKGLTAINELPAAAKEADSIDEEAIRSAESAALALWSTLEELRHTLADAQAKDPSKKRKRPAPVSPTASSASLWKRMTELESESLAHRRAILDKWSLKIRGSSATLPNARGKLLGASTGSAQQTITAVLDAHVASEISGERAAKRSRRENQPDGIANGTSDNDASEPIYDDTLFYQSLLRDLVEQRMSSSDAITNGVDALHIQLPSTSTSSGRTGPTIHPVTGMRKDKVKRAVDTKASKGRKMRYNVHEKLQNFMAPEDRGTWTSRAREEFFASLLGKTASGMLGEGSDEEEDGGVNGAADDSDEDAEEGGLRLFRSQ